MGLVLTLVSGTETMNMGQFDNTASSPQFKASVWAVINEQPIAENSSSDTTADVTRT